MSNDEIENRIMFNCWLIAMCNGFTIGVSFAVIVYTISGWLK